MTIDSGWVQHLKKECPAAFQPTLPTRPTTWFIDGQIKLMKAEWIDTWELFLQRQIFDTIDRAFELNASVVVLGFDDYTHVPLCKSMTQRARNVKQAVFTWNEANPLPQKPPDDWAACMRCRPFKCMVIGMLVRNVSRIYKNHDKTVIIDWMGAPVVLGRALELDGRALPAAVLDPLARRGECDIKALAWSTFGALVVQSTDGDFVPLALLQPSDSAAPIYLERLMTHLTPAKKRSLDGDRKRQLEYVCINTLLARVNELLPSHASPAATLATMIALTGCDFCNSMPVIGPAKLWAAKHATRGLDFATPEGVLAAVTAAYQLSFSKHIRPARQGDIVSASRDAAESIGMYESVRRNITSNSATSQKHKDSIWTARPSASTGPDSDSTRIQSASGTGTRTTRRATASL